ncbi:uncharacterized protein SPAPADRAFT_63490 [Spathaspora passalidarum NRRL Y-27907]|uniref:Uncharacterized protein n=1 Tax=Spathaspora passalidarum (strain NRRL Y-27907 / 11-Y1) TaxID=619300 RepID=G3AV67_SPAPN|nr:uncharacterized protein SPAPADRAFT_63490 [Spathaspora passalidarum NRRL Y-27907]EGW29870.1 hypothetical protein SPAPADRAFT_63490 [Spathaspora passalidarum NRRL Y-27907]
MRSFANICATIAQLYRCGNFRAIVESVSYLLTYTKQLIGQAIYGRESAKSGVS